MPCIVLFTLAEDAIDEITDMHSADTHSYSMQWKQWLTFIIQQLSQGMNNQFDMQKLGNKFWFCRNEFFQMLLFVHLSVSHFLHNRVSGYSLYSGTPDLESSILLACQNTSCWLPKCLLLHQQPGSLPVLLCYCITVDN